MKQVHIGEDVWLCGRQKRVTKPGETRSTLHMVIYGPENKEYHIWGQDVYDLCTDVNEWGEKDFSNCNRHGNSAIHSKLKIYILTHILDDKSNWCFDLTEMPPNGPLKVMCKNGTVKNIEFDGVFHKQELVSKRITWNERSHHGIWPMYSYSDRKFVDVVAYRKK